MRICVVALGKIGLPLAVQCAMKGHDVTGADVNADVVADVAAGRVPFPGEANLPEHLAEVVGIGRLRATTDTTAAVSDADVVVVVVPLVVGDDGVPDFRAMDAATSAISAGIRPGTLVSYETTLPVGTTRGRFAPALVAGSGLRLGENLFVCHSPERVFSGRIFEDLRKYPKLIGGLDDPSSKRAAEFYEAVLDFDPRPDLARGNGVWDLGSVEAAELAKLAETTYRDVNIGLANTFAMYADSIGVDIFAVIEASNSQPFSHIHQPGIAVGGHCIPVYPRFYLSGDPTASVVAAARDVNEAMPGYAVSVLTSMLDSIAGSKVAVLGASYRGGVKETAFSGVFPLVRRLEQVGAVVGVHDPLYTDDELRSLGFEPFHLGERCDAAVVQTDHAIYRSIGPVDLPGARAIVDGRRVLSAGDFAAAGVPVRVLGGLGG